MVSSFKKRDLAFMNVYFIGGRSRAATVLGKKVKISLV